MRGFVGAWLAGVSIVAWRQWNAQHHLPVPGALAGVSLLFAGMALLAEAVPASQQAVMWTAWGLDIAGLLNILPGGLGAQFGQLSKNQVAAQSANQAPAGNEGSLPGVAA